MSTNIDWPAIRAAFEMGVSQRTLAREYGTTQATISRRAAKEHWTINPRITPTSDCITDTANNTSIENEQTLDLVEKALRSLAKHLELAEDNNLDLKSHKLFADSLSQYVKLKMLLPDDKPTASGLPADLLKYFSMEQLNRYSEIEAEQEAIVEAVKAQKLEQEQGIKTIRKQEKI